MAVREDLARRGGLRTTKSIATNAAVEGMVRYLPTCLSQLQDLPFKELHGEKKGQKYGQVFVDEVRTFLCENRLTHLLREQTRVTPPPPGASCSRLPRVEDTDTEEFISIGGTLSAPQGPLRSVEAQACSNYDPFQPPLATQACVSQSMYFRPAPSTGALAGAKNTHPNSNTQGQVQWNAQALSTVSQYQQQHYTAHYPQDQQQEPSTGCEQRSTSGLDPELWDPEDFECLDFL
ncbi:uncharacterized protein LOC34622414 [Cyclospora cayetanensis]|uniref:Uncharacterized protein LOC34622414 n=1 Tax=Cyclospora cayetanensis TaxID=88456 RepID=A0A6P6RWI9_9EIME|nr:uncharacterized protein LOC34622414 [Cyclospora cayetanensis]